MRYLPLTPSDRAAMLAAVGVESVDDLFRDVPQSARLPGPIAGLPNHQGELAVERALSALAAKNRPAGAGPFFLGAGAYRHHVPATVDHLIQRGEFLTSYTPYQPEVTQGTLQMLFEFQTQVALLTGMEVANASMYDGATACAEAVKMATRVAKRGEAVLSGGLHPHYRDTVLTDAGMTGFSVVGCDADPDNCEDLASLVDDKTACVVVQYPSFFGHVNDYAQLADICKQKGALLIVVVTEATALGLLPSPGSMGADIVCGEGQALGNPLGFGGPYLGLFACREKLLRQMPGRLCGQTVDADGKRGYVLTLSTREQHIRREKATSNICTNSGLCALAFSIHLTLLGEAGLTKLARTNHAAAVQTADRLATIPGVAVLNDGFYNEFTLRLANRDAAEVVEKLAAKGVLAGVPVSRLLNGALPELLLVAVTETATEEDVAALVQALSEEMAA
ncbi:MAG TPA: aminomethyl-transferring glycine dehydrogenase subunit GcvPA [Azospirillaceae bacterium]|nr:aminomethyl-transferring glycine dehydrogenase subunit GcvPA [Azospirillaceae bacterium]HRQ79497.1 aminomethyl-transferring glycine dehydrogenase subunit GcvPA [Azospirillaceae bacterium]